MSVPNQRIIIVSKAKADKTHHYTIFNLKALNNACNCLNTIGGIKLFIYMGKNQNQYKFELSRADFMKWSGLAETAYRSGIKELIEKGYLVKQNGNSYLFREDRGVAIKENQKQDDNNERKNNVFTF